MDKELGPHFLDLGVLKLNSNVNYPIHASVKYLIFTLEVVHLFLLIIL